MGTRGEGVLAFRTALCLLLACCAVVLRAQQNSDVRASYSKYEYMIPMRDGVRLYTAAYVPKRGPGNHPILMVRTPYSAGNYGKDHYPQEFRGLNRFQAAGYIFVFQDVRGKYLSEGEFVNVRPEHPGRHGLKEIDESTDTYDTVDYLVKNVPNNNGRVGLWGISYPGFYAGAGAIGGHPALKAVSPQAPVSDWFVGDDFHHHGAFFLQDAFDFLSFFGWPRPTSAPDLNIPRQFDHQGDAYKFFLDLGPLPNADKNDFKGEVAFWNDLMAHGVYDDFWRDRSLPSRMRGVKAAVLVVGGWFDAEDQWGALHLYEATARQNPDAPVSLVMGPWFHGMWARSDGSAFGDISFGQPTSEFYQNRIFFPFFDHYLRDAADPHQPAAEVFETGANRWLTFDHWPPAGLKPASFYFTSGKRLASQPPSESGETAFDEYVSDPANPVPYTDGKHERRTREYMIDDQRWAEKRPDVLAYRSDPFPQDVTFAGPITADLFVESTGTDADFVVKVIDLYPDDAPDVSPSGMKLGGYEMTVRVDVMRAKFRKSYTYPTPLTPGKVERVSFTLPDVCHTFRKGHHLMVQVQSSWFPLVDRNPQQFEDIYHAKASDFIKATERILRTSRYPSRLRVNLLDAAAPVTTAHP